MDHGGSWGIFGDSGRILEDLGGGLAGFGGGDFGGPRGI